MTSGPDKAMIYRRWAWLFLTLICAVSIIGIAVPAGLGWDFANFYDAGRRAAAGQYADLYSPLSAIDGRPPQGSTGFFGAPLSAFFYAPLAGFQPATALAVFKFQNVLALGTTFGLLLGFYRPFVSRSVLEPWRFTALFAFLCLIYQPFWTIFRVGGQTTPTVLLLLTMGLIAHTKGRFWTSAMCVLGAGLIKPSLAPAILLLGCVSGVAYLWRTAALWTATGALSLLIMGWPVHAVFLENMIYRSQLKYSWFYNSSLEVLFITLREYFGQAAATGVLNLTLISVTYALRGAVVLTLLWLALRARRAPVVAAARRHLEFSLMMVFYIVWSPTLYEHYLSLLFPFLVYVVATNNHFSRQALVLVALIFIFAIGQNLIFINWIRYGFELNSLPELVGIALFKSAPVSLTMVLLWLHGRELIQSHSAPEWMRYEA
ncbi:MAG: glycosyltransferase 87 family protein [Vicinamibacterales bacterium]